MSKKKGLLKACGILEILFGLLYAVAIVCMFVMRDTIVQSINNILPNASFIANNFAYLSAGIVALLIIDVIMYVLNIRAKKALSSNKQINGTLMVQIVLSILSVNILLLIIYIVASLTKDNQTAQNVEKTHDDDVPVLGMMSVDDICVKCKVSKEDARLMATPVGTLKQMVEDGKLSKEKYVDILIKIGNSNKRTR